MSLQNVEKHEFHRRSFLHNGSLCLLGAGIASSSVRNVFADKKQCRVRIGMITDLHYADKPPAGSRHYRETLAKIAEAGERFRQDKIDLVIELGDLIDAADSVKDEKNYLSRINKEISALPGDKHYVLGNHCVTTLTKAEFLEGVHQKKSHYSFDQGGFHFVVLDACFRQDGEPYGRKNFKWNDANIPQEQIEWLEADLNQATGKTIVFVHQRLDVKNDYGVNNAEEVRNMLEKSGKVLAVFQGHSHKNDVKDLNGIHYCTLVAMVEGSGGENSGYSVMDVFDDGTLQVTGFRKQSSYDWKAVG